MMHRTKRLLLASVLLLFAGFSAGAQQYDAFFRGRQDAGYFMPFNGNSWWEGPDYKPGTVFYDGKLYEGLSLNVNANNQTLLVMRGGEVIPMALESGMVRWFTMEDKLFVNLRLLGYDKAPEGFFEVISDGEIPVLRRISKNLRGDTIKANGAIIGYDDPFYKDNVTTFFEKVSTCYIILDGEPLPLKTKTAVRALCSKSEKKALRRKLLETFRALKHASVEDFAVALATLKSEGGASPLVLESSFAPMPQTPWQTAAKDAMAGAERVKAESLPADWFEPEMEGGTVRYVSGMPVVAIYRNKVYELGLNNSSNKAQSVLIQGVVTDSEEGKPVIGALVYEKLSGNYTTTDANGIWSLDVTRGENVITFSELSMEDFPVMVTVNDKARLDVVMAPKSELLNGVVISADARAAHRTPRMGVEKLSLQTISRVPTAFGEGDVLKAVQSLPGVQSVGEASGGINVRGGSADQNLILYNGSTIYNPTHMFGIFSAFDPNLVDGVELYKSSIPAEYGGRLSSVMDVSGKDGSFEKFKGALGLGVLTSHAVVETPIGKDKKTSIILGGRTTYSNYILNHLPPQSGYSGGEASFGDVSARVTHKIRERSVVRANVYWSSDRFGFTGDTTFHYSNMNASLRWDNQVSKSTSMSFYAGYDSFRSNLEDTHDPYESFLHSIGVNQMSSKLAVNRTLSGNHELNLGFEAIIYTMNPGELKALGDESTIHGKQMDKEHGTQASVWISDTWKPLPALAVDGGIRFSGFVNPSATNNYTNPEIRLSGKYSASQNLSFKAGFNTMSQYIHLISNSTSMSPMDTWKLSDDKVHPQTGWQGAGGAYLTAFDGMVDFSAEAYYKRSYHGIDYKSGANLFMNYNLADDLVETTGKAYGVELMAKKTSGALNGWLSYTYSRSFLRESSDRGVLAINGGEWYRAPHDKPHSVQLVGNYEFTHRYSLSFNMDYSTGRPITIPVGHYYYDGLYRLLYSDRNAYRIPDYFRLDLALNVEPGHNLKKLTHFSCTFGVYNVTGRKNAYSVYYTTTDYTVQGHMVSVFAMPIPYASINMKF